MSDMNIETAPNIQATEHLEPVTAPLPPSKKPPGPWMMVVKKFFRNPYAVTGLIILLFFIVISSLANVISPYDPAKIDLMSANLKAGTGDHLLGTDELGRDIFSRLLHSGRISLTVGFSVAAISVIIGTLVGAISGFFGGWIDTIFMRLIDVMNSIPTLFLNILVMAIFGTKIQYMIMILAFTSWMGVARLVRGTYLQLREMQYVEAARAIGVSRTGIIFRHLLRNASFPIIVNATLMVGGAILNESGLSYLGLGIQAPATSWGLMLSNSQEFMLIDPMQAVYPGVCILAIGLAVNFIGDGIRDAMDPRQKKKISRRRLDKWRKNYSKSGI